MEVQLHETMITLVTTTTDCIQRTSEPIEAAE